MIDTRLFFVVLILVSCSVKTADQRFREYINNPANKILQQVNAGSMTVTAKFITEMGKRFLTNDYYYFNITFDRGVSDKLPHEKLLYADFDMHQDFFLVTETDSCTPAICQKIENGLPGKYEYILAFEPRKKDKDFILVYRDKIFGIGTVDFAYKKKDIDKIPGIKTKMAQ